VDRQPGQVSLQWSVGGCGDKETGEHFNVDENVLVQSCSVGTGTGTISVYLCTSA
jgi:hypothetical protein